MRIVQLSDLHICRAGQRLQGIIDTASMVEAAVAAVNALDPAPDLILITGDLVDLGLPEEYGIVREMLQSLRTPVYVIPGNHDDRAAFSAAFGGSQFAGDGFLQFVLEDWPLRIVGLDTNLSGAHEGELCPARLDWLERALATRPDTPTIVAMHHPPLRTHIGHVDRIPLVGGAPRFADIVVRNPQIEAVLCGHVHRTIVRRWQGTVAMTIPSVAHQVPLDLTPEAPAAFIMEPPGFAVHLWDDGDGLVTHIAQIGDHGPPHLFAD